MITASMFKDFRNDLNNALKEIGDKYGIVGKMGNIKYNDNDFRFTVEMFSKDGNTSVQNRYIEAYKFQCTINPELPVLGTTIKINGKIFTIEGWNTRKKKNNVILNDENGDVYVCPVQTILINLKK